MLSYKEYKLFQIAIQAGFNAALRNSVESGKAIEMSTLEEIHATAAKAAGIQDRVVDIIECRRFLGFVIIVNKYPEEFSKDKKFWVDSVSTANAVIDSIKSGLDSYSVSMVDADPDVVMSKNFVNNPDSLIK